MYKDSYSLTAKGEEVEIIIVGTDAHGKIFKVAVLCAGRRKEAYLSPKVLEDDAALLSFAEAMVDEIKGTKNE